MELLKWDACYNIRDLGGYRAKDGRAIRRGALVRADNLCRLTEPGRRALVEYGVRTIIDLRFPEELAVAPHPFANGSSPDRNVSYMSLPLRDEKKIDLEKVFNAAQNNLERYSLALDYNGKSFARVMTAIAQAKEGGVLFHCHAGRDRTGLVSAMLLSLAGVEPETIVEDYVLSDQYLKPLYEQWFDPAKNPKDYEAWQFELARAEQTMAGWLSYLDKDYGGAEAYLRAQGVSDEIIQLLRRRIVD